MSKFITPDSEDQEPLKGRPKIFLAATIDNGDSPDWQRRLFDQYKGKGAFAPFFV